MHCKKYGFINVCTGTKDYNERYSTDYYERYNSEVPNIENTNLR
jgi:hypothetical protein